MTNPIHIPEFLSRVVGRTDAGRDWLARLPALVDRCAERWDLTIDPPMTEAYAVMSYNYITPVIRADGTEAILKIGSSSAGTAREGEILTLLGGSGAVELIDYSEDLDALLLERLKPGVPLSEQPDDEENMRVIARLMRRIWRPPPAGHQFRPVGHEIEKLNRLRTRYDGDTGPLPAIWAERAVACFRELSEAGTDPVVLHGDLHHWNILSADREPWLAIAPKGLVGDPCYEIMAPLNNYPPASCAERDKRTLLERRVDILVEELDFDRTYLLSWAWALNVIAAEWNINGGDDWKESIERAEILYNMR